jgi:hypothetical protein
MKPFPPPPESRETGALSLQYRQISFKDAHEECLRSAALEFGPGRYILKALILFDKLTSIGTLPEMVNEVVVLNDPFEIDVILSIWYGLRR